LTVFDRKTYPPTVCEVSAVVLSPWVVWPGARQHRRPQNLFRQNVVSALEAQHAPQLFAGDAAE
jgi:hypothetical protein